MRFYTTFPRVFSRLHACGIKGLVWGWAGGCRGGENSVSETIESDQCHRAASWINIQRSGSASQKQRQRRSWINIVDKWSVGTVGTVGMGVSFRVSLVGTIGLVGMVGGSPQVCHLHRPDPTHVGSDPAAPIRPIWIPIQWPWSGPHPVVSGCGAENVWIYV